MAKRQPAPRPLARYLALLLALCLVSLPAGAQTPEPTVDRLAAPVMPANPTQADHGAQVYYQVCMSCHGDRGQGLTDEWRSAWAPGDQDCWQRKCHGANHPPEGFELVRYVPPVIGPGILDRYYSAAGLKAFIQGRMPWEAPGSLTDEEYWQVTAFLLRANGVYDGEPPLAPDNADSILIAGTASQATAELPALDPAGMPHAGLTGRVWPFVLAAVLIAVALAAVYFVRRGRATRS